MKKTLVSLLLVIVLVVSLCLTSCSEDTGKILAETARSDYGEYSKKVTSNVFDAIADSYVPLSIIEDSLKDGKISVEFDADKAKGAVELFLKDGKFASIVKDKTQNKEIGIYCANKVLTLDLTDIGAKKLDTPISFAFDWLADAIKQPEIDDETIRKIADILNKVLIIDITDENELKEFIGKLGDCIDRTIEEKPVTIGNDEIKSIVATVSFDKDSLIDVAKVILSAVDLDAIIDMIGIKTAKLPDLSEIEEKICSAFDFSATAVYAVSADNGLPVLYTLDASFTVDPSVFVKGTEKIGLDLKANVEFPADMSVYKPFNASLTASGSLLKYVLGSTVLKSLEEDDEITVSLIWDPDNSSKEEFSSTLKLQIKALEMTLTPFSLKIKRSKKSGDFTVSAKAGLPGKMHEISANGSIKSEFKKTSIKIDSVEFDEEKKDFGITFTFEKGCDFPEIPESKRINSFKDLPGASPRGSESDF